MVGASVGRRRSGAGVDYCGANNLFRPRFHLAKPRTDYAGSIVDNERNRASIDHRTCLTRNRGRVDSSMEAAVVHQVKLFVGCACWYQSLSRNKARWMRNRKAVRPGVEPAAAVPSSFDASHESIS